MTVPLTADELPALFVATIVKLTALPAVSPENAVIDVVTGTDIDSPDDA